MKRRLLSMLIILIPAFVCAQKLYVWKPKKQQVSVRPFYQKTDTIDVIIFDGRIINEKSKVECTSEEVINEFQDIFRQAYSNATLIIHNSKDYYKKAYPNHLTIKVGIAAYHAGFGSDIQVGIGSVGGSFSYGFFPKVNGMLLHLSMLEHLINEMETIIRSKKKYLILLQNQICMAIHLLKVL